MSVRKAVMPVAGFGTRFLPATKATPKEMFPLVDKPLAQHVVEEAVEAGIEEIIFVTGQSKRAIEDHFDSNFELEYLLEQKGKTDKLKEVKQISDMCRFAYVRQKEMKGLGDAILQAKNLVNDEPFVVMTPDDIFSNPSTALSDVIAAYDKTQTPVIGVTEVPKERVSAYGVIEPKGDEQEPGLVQVAATVEKPETADAPSGLAQCGRYLFLPEIFDILENLDPGKGGEIQMTDAVNELAQQRPVYAATIQGEYHDAGSKIGYLKAIVEFALQREDTRGEFRTYLDERLKQ